MKAGDKVRVLPSIRTWHAVNETMKGMVGSVLTLTQLRNSEAWEVKENCWVWGVNCLELIKEEPMKNYICIDGKQAELTDDQLRKLGIEPPKKSPFERAAQNYYFSVGEDGSIYDCHDSGGDVSKARFNVANYCTDKSIMERRAMHETLSRLLWRFAMENGGIPEINTLHFCIQFDGSVPYIDSWYTHNWQGTQRFVSREITQRAIDEIVKPFLAAHPDFRW